VSQFSTLKTPGPQITGLVAPNALAGPVEMGQNVPVSSWFFLSSFIHDVVPTFFIPRTFPLGRCVCVVPVEGHELWSSHFLRERPVQCRMAVDTSCIFIFEELTRLAFLFSRS
jgi:hypothetical protein